MRKAIPAALFASLFMATAASARPAITMAGAERAATRLMVKGVAEENWLTKESEEPGEPLVVRATLDECTIERYRGECEDTEFYSDGTEGDNTIAVWMTRSGHVAAGWVPDRSV